MGTVKVNIKTELSLNEIYVESQGTTYSMAELLSIIQNKITRQLMDRIQSNINRFYEEYLDGDLSDNNQ